MQRYSVKLKIMSNEKTKKMHNDKNMSQQGDIQRDIALLILGVLLGVGGGLLSDYLTLFLKEDLLQSPIKGAMLAALMISPFVIFIFFLIFRFLERERQSAKKHLVGGLIVFVIIVCVRMPAYLYQNAIKYQPSQMEQGSQVDDITTVM